MRKVFALLSFACMLAIPAAAQDELPRREIFGGFSHQTSEDVGLNGWTAGVGYNFADNFGVEAQASGHYGSEEFFVLGVDSNIHNFHAGPKAFIFDENNRFGAFVHLLFGASHVSADTGVRDDSDTAFSWVIGIGADINVTRRFGARLGADLLRTNFFDEGDNNGRYTVGVVYRF